MPIESLFNRTLEIRRRDPSAPASVDDWNQPAYDADQTLATVPGTLQQLSDREVALLTDAGAQIGDYRAFLAARYVAPDGTSAPTDVQTADRIIDVASAAQYEVRSVIDAAGRGHHLELMLRRVVD